MQYIFPTHYLQSHDHCRECGGEEHEGQCGKLRQYVVVTLDSRGVVERFGAETVCDGCADAIDSRMKFGDTLDNPSTAIMSDDDVFSLEEFIEMCDTGGIMNDDGTGYLANDEEWFPKLRVTPSEVLGCTPKDVRKRYNAEFVTHVVWFNK